MSEGKSARGRRTVKSNHSRHHRLTVTAPERELSRCWLGAPAPLSSYSAQFFSKKNGHEHGGFFLSVLSGLVRARRDSSLHEAHKNAIL